MYINNYVYKYLDFLHHQLNINFLKFIITTFFLIIGIPSNLLMLLTVAFSKSLRKKAYSHFLAALSIFCAGQMIQNFIDDLCKYLDNKTASSSLEAQIILFKISENRSLDDI